MDKRYLQPRQPQSARAATTPARGSPNVHSESERRSSPGARDEQAEEKGERHHGKAEEREDEDVQPCVVLQEEIELETRRNASVYSATHGVPWTQAQHTTQHLVDETQQHDDSGRNQVPEHVRH